MSDKASRIIDGLGGAANIIEVEACITRVRTEVRDPALVDESALQDAGALVWANGIAVQLVVLPPAADLAEAMQGLL